MASITMATVRGQPLGRVEELRGFHSVSRNLPFVPADDPLSAASAAAAEALAAAQRLAAQAGRGLLAVCRGATEHGGGGGGGATGEEEVVADVEKLLRAARQ